MLWCLKLIVNLEDFRKTKKKKKASEHAFRGYSSKWEDTHQLYVTPFPGQGIFEQSGEMKPNSRKCAYISLLFWL